MSFPIAAEPFQLDANETLSPDQLRVLQTRRMKASLAHAFAGNPHFRQTCRDARVAPDDFADLADLRKFPFSGKADLRAAYPFGYFAVPMRDIARIHASSGTTGNPTVVGYTRDDIRTWAGLVARSIHAAGGRPGMKVHVAYGYGLFTGGLGAHYGAEELGCTVIPMSGGQTEKQIQLIQDFKPEIIMVTPSYMLSLLDELEARGIDPRSTSLRIGIFGAEPWTEAMRAEIEARLAIRAVDIYGLSEVIGPGVAQEYGATQDGPTIWEDHFYPEIVDPETGEPLPDGEEGELVFTSLSKQAMPIIRYRTRDLTRLLPGSQGPMRRMAKITGRSDDMLIIRGVNVFPSQIEEQLLKCAGLAPHYLIEISRPGRMDEMTVQVERRTDCGEGEGAAHGRELAQYIKVHIGISVTVEVVASGSLPRSMGKAARIRDLRGS
ncbi:phenylacetate--CoA ligase PaaK [Sphingosinicella rhizophila]|uniref:Phenylacetate-coenzyme A ligase n=1 Tax=Sphingosinicella rhizophila TaxID=3050082 RepID=A0ABU3QB60_9SPHN|nr:phenylacetate--CoA ligase PaaK [Sphingosinicella sp. GR2756]MDT9600190.1 phenylacetate--CoA ligase PaaK [Sphingosinicella sp. GR2756]